MVFSIWNKKGGVGKTALSYSLAKDLDYSMMSNDDSMIEIAYPDRAVIDKNPILVDNFVYDFGGFSDLSIEPILKGSDYIIIPTIADYNGAKKLFDTLEDLETMKIPKERILVVSMRTGDTFKKDDIDSLLDNQYQTFYIPDSKIFQKLFTEKKSINEIGNTNGLSKYTYRKVLAPYNELLNKLKG